MRRRITFVDERGRVADDSSAPCEDGWRGLVVGQKPILRCPVSGLPCASLSSHRVRIFGSCSASALDFLATVAKSAGVKPLSLSTRSGGSAAKARRYASAIWSAVIARKHTLNRNRRVAAGSKSSSAFVVQAKGYVCCSICISISLTCVIFCSHRTSRSRSPMIRTSPGWGRATWWAFRFPLGSPLRLSSGD
jgi:hypothetical protein